MKKLLCLFLGIIGISSCTNDNFIEPQTENTTFEIVHKKLTYQQASKAINKEPAFDEKLKNSFHENFTSLSNNLNKTTNSTEESTEILIDYFFDPVHDNETYSFITHEFTGTVEDDYLEKFVLTVEEGEQKVGYLRYYPTTDFSTEYFTGNVQVLSLNHTEVYESYIENGITIQNQTNSRSTDCITKITFGSTRCSNGGHHRYGIPCTGNAVNDAYQYLLVDVFCRDNISFPRDVSAPSPVFIMDSNPNRGGGGGSNNSQAQQNSFMNSLPDAAKQYLNEKPEIKYSFMMYLGNKKFSAENKDIARQLSVLIANDSVLKNNDLLTELIVKQILFSDKYTVQEFENFWSNLTPAQKAIFNNYAINGISANGNFLKPSVQTFLSWAFPYIIDNPTVTVEQFENWFMGKVEGVESLNIYDESYWNNPNLTFTQQNLPSYDDFFTNYPDATVSAYDLCHLLIGGQIATLYNDILATGTQINTCAIRMSYALNESGVKIPNIPGKTKRGTIKSDGTYDYYFTFAKDINKWMRETFGTNDGDPNTPHNPKHKRYTKAQGGANGALFPELFMTENKKGIFSIVSPQGSKWATGHADCLKPDQTCVNDCHFYDGDIQFIDIWELD